MSITLANLRFEKLEASRADQYITVSVDFKQIAVERVEPQSSDRNKNKTMECVSYAICLGANTAAISPEDE